ncbi:hypothetical protein [Phytohabitans houttuyneae]|uniref:hypothetical protein n=1 Tax=Phytohabitans houttuyneae TaxID=1076126 RepID=UPI00156474D2|nr:hypothetical protein [Phytohabitans houttuyneae]
MDATASSAFGAARCGLSAASSDFRTARTFFGTARRGFSATRTGLGTAASSDLGAARACFVFGAARSGSGVRVGERTAGLGRFGCLAAPHGGEPAAARTRRRLADADRPGVEQPDTQQATRGGIAPKAGRRRPRVGIGLRRSQPGGPRRLAGTARRRPHLPGRREEHPTGRTELAPVRGAGLRSAGTRFGRSRLWRARLVAPGLELRDTGGDLPDLRDASAHVGTARVRLRNAPACLPGPGDTSARRVHLWDTGAHLGAARDRHRNACAGLDAAGIRVGTAGIRVCATGGRVVTGVAGAGEGSHPWPTPGAPPAEEAAADRLAVVRVRGAVARVGRCRRVRRSRSIRRFVRHPGRVWAFGHHA